MNNQVEIMFHVVVNHEEQHSIWPSGQTIPQGWRAVGQIGSKESCLAYINKVWTDMRPLSVRGQEAVVTVAE